MTSVSVAMATYNGESHIRKQLDSLAAQSHLPVELVITDDISTDNTLQVIEAFARTAPFQVRIYVNENRLGYRVNFMRAAGLCRSELIAFCDQDDIWYPHKLATSIKPFSDPEILLTYHNADIVTEGGTRISSLVKFAAKTPILERLSSKPHVFALGLTEIFRRSLLPFSYLRAKTLDQNAVDQPLAHDQWVYFLASVFGKIAYLDESLAAYVQHESNTCGIENEGSRISIYMKRFARDRSDEYELLSKTAKSRAEALEIANSNLDGIWAERAAAGAAFYRNVASVYNRRIALYASSNLTNRIKAFRAIVAMNGYTSVGGLGRKGLLADICLGVIPIGSLMRFIGNRAGSLRAQLRLSPRKASSGRLL